MASGNLRTRHEHYPSGALKAEWTERDGMLEGVRRFWFENGQLLAEAEYQNGVVNGLIRQWTQEGQLTLLATAKDGEFHGRYQSWWDDGVKKEEGVYLLGKLQKGYRWYRPNGDLWRELGIEGE